MDNITNEMRKLKKFILRAMLMAFIANVIVIYSAYIYMNAQYAGYENDIVWRLYHGGKAVPLEIQSMTREQLLAIENVP